MFVSKIDISSPSFETNTKENKALLDKMNLLLERAAQTSEKRRDIFEKRNQLSPRERLGALLDPGLPFLELFNMAGYCVCLLYTSPSPRDISGARMPSSA